MGPEQGGSLRPVLLEPGVDRRKQEPQRVQRREEVQPAGAHPAAEDAEGVLEQPGRSAAREVLHRALHRGVGPRLDVEVEPAGEAHRAQDAHRVLAEADLRVADGADLARPRDLGSPPTKSITRPSATS